MGLYLSQIDKSLEVIQLLYSRNKNQHRHARWWVSFSALRRCMLKLSKELQIPTQARALRRCKTIEQHLVPQCYRYYGERRWLMKETSLMPRRSFRQSLHDGQFAVLGLTLLAELASIETHVRRIIASGPMAEDRSDAVVVLDATSTSGKSEDVGRPVERTSSPPLPSNSHSEYCSSRQVAPRTRNVSRNPYRTTATIAPNAIDRIFVMLD